MKKLSKGLKYKKMDLHVHTPASHDFKDKEITPEQIVEHCQNIGLDAIAITDHNTGEYIDKIKKVAKGKVTIFPGVEISCLGGQSGIHIIGIFDVDKTTKDIEAILAKLDIKAEKYGKEDAITTKSVNDVINLISEGGGIAVAAHSQSSKGVLREMQGLQRTEVMNNPNLLAVEAALESDFLNEEKAKSKKRTIDILNGEDVNYKRKLAVYVASDSKKNGIEGHCIEGIGEKFTYFKTDDEITLESLRQCFIDRDVRIKQMYEEIEKRYPYIKEVNINSGFFKDQKVYFHPGLNSIIGPKGAGKSLLIEIIRFALNQPSGDNEIYKDHLEKLKNKVGNYAEIKIKYVDSFGNEKEIIKNYNEKDPYEDKGNVEFPVLFLSQNEIIKTAESEEKQIEFIDKFFDFRDFKLKILTLKNELKKLDSQYASGIMAFINNKLIEKNIIKVRKDIEDIEKELKNPEYFVFKKKENAQQMSKLQRNDLQRLLELKDNIVESIANFKLNDIDKELVEEFPELKRNNDRLINIKNILSNSIENLKEEILNGQVEFENDEESLKKAFEKSRDSYEEKLKSKMIDFNIEKARKSKVDELSKFIDQQQKLKTQVDNIKIVKETREKVLNDLEKIYAEYSQKRKEICSKLEEISGGRLKINLYESSNKQLFKEKLKEIKKGSYIKDEEIDKIVDKIDSNEFVKRIIRYYVLQDENDKNKEVDAVVEGKEISGNTIKLLFDFLIKQLKIEEILEISYAYRAEDVPEIQLEIENGIYEDINKVSVGQKCTAMLIIALSQGDMPVVIDQPEDSLDLKSIWEDMCKKIRNYKDNRQFIFTTHNSSLAVASDTDKYIVINSNARRGEIVNTGALDTKETKENVVNYLEGKEDTYVRKYNKYGFKY